MAPYHNSDRGIQNLRQIVVVFGFGPVAAGRFTTEAGGRKRIAH